MADHDTKLPTPTPRQVQSGEILRARPVQGEIDHRELTREFMARYPKILAALREAELRCKK